MTYDGIVFLLLLWQLAAVSCDVALECNPESIQATFSDSFLLHNNIDVTSEEQIHFKDNASCSSVRVQNGYVLTLYPPYTECGTRINHDTEDYVYVNEIVFTTDTANKLLLNLQCTYEDKYVVSAPFGLTPRIRTLNFATSRGTLSVSIQLYHRRDYHPKSRLGSRPSVLVGSIAKQKIILPYGVPVYVSVDMYDVFGDDDIVTSLQSCYATTNPDFEQMSNNQHLYLIAGRCASPDDRSVEIFSNGEGPKARFSFQMFRWKQSKKEYIYLHCEVNICNKSADVCSGSGPLCNGVNGNAARKRRSVLDEGKVLGTSGFITWGPIAMAKLQTKGKPSYETNLDIVQDQKFLTTYIIGGVFAILLIVGLCLAVAIAVKRHRHNQKLTRTNSSTNTINKNQTLPETL